MSASDEERLARLALSQVFEPGDYRIAGLANQLGGVRVLEMLRTGEHDLPKADVAGRLLRVEPDRQLEYGHRRGLRYIVPGDPEWPRQLDVLDEVAPLYERTGCPMGLWVRGPVRLDTLAKSVAIVGTRSATTYGADTAAAIAADVGRAGYAVVSGAAYGIDVAAHRGALAAGVPTIAVLACGADRIYPPSHRRLFDILAREGAIVSELAPGLPPTRLRFLSRNRIIAGMALGTVVVEAARRSGAHNTATWTNRLSRPVMAVPGPITSEASEGVHRMLRAGEATLVTSGEEVLEMIAPTGQHLTFDEPAPAVPRDGITLREQQVLDAVPVGSGAPVDSVSHAAGMSVLAVQASLRVLQERGLVTLAGDGWRLTAVALRATGGSAP